MPNGVVAAEPEADAPARVAVVAEAAVETSGAAAQDPASEPNWVTADPAEAVDFRSGVGSARVRLSTQSAVR